MWYGLTLVRFLDYFIIVTDAIVLLNIVDYFSLQFCGNEKKQSLHISRLN